MNLCGRVHSKCKREIKFNFLSHFNTAFSVQCTRVSELNNTHIYSQSIHYSQERVGSITGRRLPDEICEREVTTVAMATGSISSPAAEPFIISQGTCARFPELSFVSYWAGLDLFSVAGPLPAGRVPQMFHSFYLRFFTLMKIF